jgi:ABC-type multidrug transport system permease subunit
MIKELFAVIEKNIRRLLRSKTSALIILLGPLLLIALLGIAFNQTGLFGIHIGIYSDEYAPLANSLIEQIEAKEFKLIKEESLETCILNVENGKTHLCIVFPANIDSASSIEFHVDYSRLSLVFSLLNVISNTFTEQSSELSLNLVKTMLQNINATSDILDTNSLLIADLRDNAGILSERLTNLQTEVASVKVEQNFSALEFSSLEEQTINNKALLVNYERSVDQQINSSLERLNEVETMVIQAEKDVEENRKRSENIENSLRASFESQHCTEEGSTDLTPYIEDSEAFVLALASVSNPTCSITYSLLRNTEDSTIKLRESERQLENILVDIQTTKAELLVFQDESKNVFAAAFAQLDSALAAFSIVENTVSEAEQQVAELELTKNNLASELNATDSLIADNLATFDSIELVLNNIKDNIQEITSVTPESIVNPLSTQIKPLKTDMKKLDYFFPGLIVLVVMFVSVLLASTLILKEKESKAYFRNFITPTNNFLFILGAYMTTLMISFIQIFIIIVIGGLFFAIPLGANFGATMIIIIFIITAFSLIGIGIGNLMKSEETATLASIILSVILFIMSSMMIPIESMNPALAGFVKLNPFVISEFLLRRSIIFNAGFGELGLNFGLLILELLTFLGFAVWSFGNAKKSVEE